MDKLFEMKYDLRTSDFDKFNHIKPASVLDLFQDAAGRHAEEIGVGFEAMKEHSYFWVLIKIRFQVISQPSFQQKVIVKTWPLAPNKFIYRREYSISQRRRLVSAPDLYPFSDDFHPVMNFEEKLEGVEDFEANTSSYSITPGFSELDVNNHVNNTKYANFVFDAINPKEEFDIDVFQIDYRKEVLEGTQLHLYHTRKENEVIAKGINNDGDTMFACKLKYK